MTIKLMLFKSGEDLIADVAEMVVGENEESKRTVGYFLTKPCIVKMRNPTQVEDAENKKTGFEVSLFPWIPLSKDERIPITAEWVITITEPVDNLKEMYIKDVMKDGKNDQDTSSSEQPDSNKSD